MENKKFQVYFVFFILTIILINSYGFPIHQNKSKIYSPNLYQYNKSSTPNSNILSQSQIEEGNHTSLKDFLISNSLGVIEPTSIGEYTSYNGGNITVGFEIIDLDFSNSTVLDINNQANYLIRYQQNTGAKENGTISNQLSFSDRTKKYSGILDTSILSEGNYTIIIEIDLLNYYFIPFNFTLVLKTLLALEMISISHVHGEIKMDSNKRYNTYPKANITVKFKLLEMNFNISEVLDINNTAIYLISYFNTPNSEINGTLLSYINFDNETETYSGIIETHVLSQETYFIDIYVDLLNYTFVHYRFKLRVRIYLDLEMISVSDPGGVLENKPNVGYTIFIESNLTVEFKLLEMDFNISEVLDINNSAIYLISYFYTSNSEINGTLLSYINFDNETENYFGVIETSVLLEGTYRITIDIDLLNKTFEPHIFTLKVKRKYEVLISISKPREIIVGEKLTVSIFTQYKEQLDPIEDASIKLTVRINGGNIIAVFTLRTNSLGYVSIDFFLPLKTNKISLDVEVAGEFYRESAQLIISDIRVITLLEVVVILIFYIGLIISSIFISILLYIKFIIPNKREKARMIDEYKQIFKDISSIEWIFIIFKRNGKCIFHKSYISKKKNQEIINKYISFLSVSKNTAKSQNLLNEISYEGKILLEANGNHITASLVLSENCSKVLKNNFKEFIYNFENLHENILENWEDNLIPYKEIEKLLEDKLNIFITQPHEIENNFLDNISLLKSESKALSFNNRFIINKTSINLFDKAATLIKKTGKNFFYISTLLNEFSKQNNKGILKFFMSINELRHKGVFNPIYHKS